MKTKNSKMDYVVLVVGVVLFVIGFYLVKTFVNPNGIMVAVPYICIGVGCGCFGHGMGNVVSKRALKTNPKLEKQMEIDKNDERNVAIINRSKAKAYDCMTFVYGALMLCFALMNVDMIVVLLLVFAYLFIQVYGIYYRCKYENEM